MWQHTWSGSRQIELQFNNNNNYPQLLLLTRRDYKMDLLSSNNPLYRPSIYRPGSRRNIRNHTALALVQTGAIHLGVLLLRNGFVYRLYLALKVHSFAVPTCLGLCQNLLVLPPETPIRLCRGHFNVQQHGEKCTGKNYYPQGIHRTHALTRIFNCTINHYIFAGRDRVQMIDQRPCQAFKYERRLKSVTRSREATRNVMET